MGDDILSGWAAILVPLIVALGGAVMVLFLASVAT